MKRREFIAIVGGAIAWPIEGLSQQASRTHRVAYLALAGTDDSTFIKERFKELGYKEGENLIFDLRSAHGQLETLGELASELVKNNPDVIITGFGTATAKAAQVATRTIPVVFSNVGDPIGSGVVQSLSRPGANVTGLAGQAAELSEAARVAQPVRSGHPHCRCARGASRTVHNGCTAAAAEGCRGAWPATRNL
jgi:putative ABC transport system substrate-binding protein